MQDSYFYHIIKTHNLNITGVVHIGAHRGIEFPFYASIPTIKHISFFEPDVDNFNILLRNTQHQNPNLTVECHNQALGPFEGTSLFYVEHVNQGQSSSCLKPKDHVTVFPHIQFTETKTVSLKPLDHYKFPKECNFLNIDVQGFELQVFQGGKKTLQNMDYVYTEINNVEFYENCAFVEDLDYFLGKLNFKRVDNNWNSDNWGDSLYIKQK